MATTPASSQGAPARSPSNRLGLDFRAAPPRAVQTPIVDIHTHVYSVATAGAFFAAADRYGIARIATMTPLDEAPGLLAAYPGRLALIAVPAWRQFALSDEFRARWLRELAEFHRLGARLCKFWMAPPIRERHGLTLAHEFLRTVIAGALDLGYEFMVHVADPTAWFQPGARYANASVFGDKPGQYEPLEWFLEHVAPRRVIAAHMGGNIEDPPFLGRLLERHPNLYLDSSATKWIVREVARRPAEVRALVQAHPQRILFGSDLVTDEKYDFDHYASRWWAHQMMWETGYRGESPIDDPDAESPPQLAGVQLPPDVLTRFYTGNAAEFKLFED